MFPSPYFPGSSAGGGGSGPTAEEIADAVVAALGSATVTVTSPVADDGETITLYRRDDYLSVERVVLTWTDSGETWPDLTGGTMLFEVPRRGISYDAEVVDAGEDAQGARFEPTTAQTAALPARDRYHLVAVLASGSRVTLVAGDLRTE